MKRHLALVITLVFLAGCAAAVVGGASAGGAYAWAKGNLTRHYLQPIKPTYDATLTALKNLSIPLEWERQDQFNGKIIGRMAKEDQKITIDLERWTDDETRVTVRVGMLGDRKQSTRVHDAIARALP